MSLASGLQKYNNQRTTLSGFNDMLSLLMMYVLFTSLQFQRAFQLQGKMKCYLKDVRHGSEKGDTKNELQAKFGSTVKSARGVNVQFTHRRPQCATFHTGVCQQKKSTDVKCKNSVLKWRLTWNYVVLWKIKCQSAILVLDLKDEANVPVWIMYEIRNFIGFHNVSYMK